MERSYNDHLPTIIKEIGVNFVSLKTLMLLDLTYNDEVLRSFSLLFRNLQNLKVFAIKFVSPKPDSDAEISDASVKIFGSELSYLCGLESFSYYYYSQPTINLSVEMVYALAEIRSLKAVIFDCLTAFEDELITAIRSLLSKRRLETLKICTAFTPLPVLDAIKSCESLKIVETRASCSDVIPFLCSTSIHPLPKQLILDWSHTIYNMNLMSPVHFYGLESLTVRLNESEMSIHILNELMKCESLRKLHCLIITSEFEFENYPVMDTISQLVSESKSLRCVEVAGGEFDIGDKEFRFFINVVSSADTLRAVKFWVPETVRSAAQQSIENLLVTNKSTCNVSCALKEIQLLDLFDQKCLEIAFSRKPNSKPVPIVRLFSFDAPDPVLRFLTETLQCWVDEEKFREKTESGFVVVGRIILDYLTRQQFKEFMKKYEPIIMKGVEVGYSNGLIGVCKQ